MLCVFSVLGGFGVQQCSLEMRRRQQRHDGIVCSSMETTVITYLFVMRLFAVLPSTIRLHFTIRTAFFLLLLHIFNIYYFCYHWRAAAARDECVRSMSIVELRHFYEPKKKTFTFHCRSETISTEKWVKQESGFHRNEIIK